MNPPNIISLGRLLATPVILWFILSGSFGYAFWLFVAAALSDALDGAIAKRFGLITKLGSYLDPIADKVLLVSIFLILGSLGYLPPWIVLLVVSRDALIVGGAILQWMLARPNNMKSSAMNPLMVSKVNTVCQILLASAVLGLIGLDIEHDFAVTLDAIVDILTVVVAASTLLSGAIYLTNWTRNMDKAEAVNRGEGEVKK